MNAATYICDCCRGEFEFVKDWDAKDEKDKLFPDIPLSNCAMVCDDCFNPIMQFENRNET